MIIFLCHVETIVRDKVFFTTITFVCSKEGDTRTQ